MVDESGYEPRSENSPFTSDLSLSDSAKKKKPCEICASVANEQSIMTCFMCNDTREHIYCARMILKRVPPLWLCEECRGPSAGSSILQVTNKTANAQVEKAVDDSIEAARLSTSNQVEEVVVKEVPIEAAPSSKTKHVVDKDDYIDQTAPSRTHQAVNNEDWIAANQVEQVVPVVPHIHQYTTDELTPDSSYPISPCSLVLKPMWERITFKLQPQYFDLSHDPGSEE